MPTRLHLLTLSEQHRLRQARRSNWRLIFVVTAVGTMAFCAGMLSGCGSSVEPTTEERVPPPVTCGTPEQPCPRVS